MTPTEFSKMVEEMERLEKAATPGPWRWEHDDNYGCYDIRSSGKPLNSGQPRLVSSVANRIDSEFIAASRQFVPRAIQELWKRDRALEIAKEALNAYKFQSAKIGGVTHYSFAAEVLQQIEEVLNGNK